ncbi:MAG: response regulator [Spirochaetia bacterium]|jgi:two-component system response regulator YesN|nr:response regulator [Spirochaetia bacterium]
MKLLICDDEEPTLRLLQKILDWKSLGIDEIQKASDGVEAFSIIKKEPPDILITDIIMPGMDGLELINRIREDDIETQIIILSAFNEFEYAQKAISYGVRGYLLKPLDENKLEQLIKESIEDIKSDISRKFVYKKSLDFAAERLLRNLLYPRNNLEEYRKIMNMLEINFNLDNFQMALISITRLDYNNYLSSTENKKTDELITQLTEKLKTTYDDKIYFFENTPDEYILLLSSCGNHIRDKVVSDLLELMCNKKNISVVIALSSFYNSCFNIHNAYEEVCSYIAKKYLFENTRILKPEMFKKKNDLPENFTLPGGNDRSRYIKKAKKYINSHFSENINLDEICNYAGISKNYFCHLFKQETGLSIWEYLTEYRIEKARELLAGSDMKNYEISYHIGYENPSYFSRIFKKLTGKSPSDYKSDIRRI